MYNKVWKSIDGVSHNVSEMSTSHIQNCLNMLQSKGFVGYSKYESRFGGSDFIKGEMAQDAFDFEASVLAESRPLEIIDWFEEELKRREKQKIRIIYKKT
jgi:hypothetical protein